MAAAVEARRDRLLKDIGRLGVDKHDVLIDQQGRMDKIPETAAALKARVAAALAQGSDRGCVAAYTEVMVNLLAAPIPANVSAVPALPLEAVTVSTRIETRLDVSAALVAINGVGVVFDPVFSVFVKFSNRGQFDFFSRLFSIDMFSVNRALISPI
jgi:hypothetical protein